MTVPEGTGPLEVVTRVHASGDNVHYAILAPVAPRLFTINEGKWDGRGPHSHPVPVPVPGVRLCLLPQ